MSMGIPRKDGCLHGACTHPKDFEFGTKLVDLLQRQAHRCPNSPKQPLSLSLESKPYSP